MRRTRLGFACLVASVLAVAAPRTSADQLSTRPAEEWMKTLDRPERLAGLHISEVVERLRLAPGNTVADLGAGTGAFSVAFGRTVAPGGTVYAVDIDDGFFPIIAQKATAVQVANVQTVLGEFTDPKLPAEVDVAFFHDVLHHIEDRAGYMKNLARYVKPAGRVVVIDYAGDQGPHRDQPELQITKAQVGAWLTDAGFRLSEEHFDVFDDKFFVVYSRQ